jgi:hypothetical protein
VKSRGTRVAGVPANEPPFGFVDEKGALKGKVREEFLELALKREINRSDRQRK